MTTSTIITDAHLPKIRQAQADLDVVLNELELAERAGLNRAPGGLDIPLLRKQVQDAKSLFAQILNVYFPGQ